MSSDCENQVKEPVVATAEARRAFESSAFACLEKEFGAVRSDKDSWGLTAVIAADKLRDSVLFLKNDPQFQMDMLVDIAGVDYLGFEDYAGPRFAVLYMFKSVYLPAHRLSLKVFVSEADLKVPTISDIYPIANWQEREVFDQFGVIFVGHPDLRRILNHVEFVGNPLRKDYPAHRRQWLSTNDYMLPVLEARLEAKGYKILSRSKEILPNEEEYLTGSIKK
ncbi:MAG: NADH-quinone oxidoreductase subunit C [Fibrobacteraceae bacterium]|nr:NADH-quinone oxidoreductase subunit C [Fibrobacteraceae bacterium]